VGCNSLSNLIKLIEFDVGFEERLEKYEGEFEKMKFWTCNFYLNGLLD